MEGALGRRVETKKPQSSWGFSVRDTGIEPVTSSVSGKRATAAPIAPMKGYLIIKSEVATGFEPVYTALQAAASPLGHATVVVATTKRPRFLSATGADDETRTRDPHLGKVMRYQLRYIRIVAVLATRITLYISEAGRKLGCDVRAWRAFVTTW